MSYLPPMYDDDDYAIIDPILDSWAQRHSIEFEREAKGYAIRSFWLRDSKGAKKVQFWAHAPNIEGYTRLHIAELQEALDSKWGTHIEWRTALYDLPSALEELWRIGCLWMK